MMKYFTGHYVNLITCGLYIGLLLVRLFTDTLSPQIITQGLIALIFIALFAFAFNLWRYLAIAKAPVSTIQAAAQGYIELNGVASTKTPIHTPLHGIPCVWYRSWAYARDHQELWRLVDFTQSDEVFQLTDHSGTCSVNPQGAEVIYTTKKTSNSHNHRYVEEYLLAAKPVYLIGHLDTRHHFNDPKKIKAEIGELITNWKSNPVQMLFRFDLDRNGEIDQSEWEKARAEARQEVEHQQMNLAHHGNFEISAPSDNKLYLLSGQSPDLLRGSYRAWVVTHLIAIFSFTCISTLL